MKAISKLLAISFFLLITCFVNAQIKVQPNGVVRVGNTTAPVIDVTNTGFQIDVPKTVVKSSVDKFWTPPLPPGLSLWIDTATVGFQIFPMMSSITNNSWQIDVGVMALTGLSNHRADIGRWNNQMNNIYSHTYFTSGPNLGLISTSDINLKTNIRELPSVTERISKLRPVVYDFVRDGSGEDVSKNPMFQSRVGFIAQEVQEVFPDLVIMVGENKTHSLDYTGLIPYLTKTIQEQNEKIERLQQQIIDIKTGAFVANFIIDMPNHAPQQAPPAVPQTTAENNILFQNVPNPFNSITTITYHLAGNVKNARICIYNLVGKQLLCYELPTIEGEGMVEVRASSLQSGMYLYSLIVDGRLIDTKRMVLTE